MIRKGLLLSFLFTLFLHRANAQCGDSTLVSYGYCDPTWIPVCGCDGKTYRNDCFARNHGLLSWYYGICDPIDFDFNPNPPTDYIDVDAIVKYTGNMYVQMTDRFGRVFYNTSFENVAEMRFQIYVKGFPTGLYFINIWCNEGYKVRKVVITDYH